MAKEFKISKSEGVCGVCGQALQPEEEIVALACSGEEELLRRDYHRACWDSLGENTPADDPEVLGVWRTRVPRPEEKKKLLVDDSLIINFFERLDGADDPAKINFRYVLALILMRKKILVYEGMDRRDGGVEVWKMRFKGADAIHEVIDPHMDEDKIAQVSSSLGEIMEGDFE
ncbi:MAG: hypothetical protein JXA11_09745 [Phycisphaerae bacterium]|nr:hypothetical protein [Phycisphaerae bacterium]